MPCTGELVYRLDDDGVIVDVNDAWDQFAVANGAPELRRELIVGRHLKHFIKGWETQYLYQRLIQRAHELGAELSVPFRCDSLTTRRGMAMTISPLPDGTEFRTKPVWFAIRRNASLLEFDPLNETLVPICSWCGRARNGENWLPVEEAVIEMRLFNRERLPDLTHGICESCAVDVTSAWNQGYEPVAGTLAIEQT